LPQAAASALGLREEPGRTLTQSLQAHLKDRKLLLLWDNCEHLLAGCAALADTLLGACPQLSILATSREGLRVEGEQIYRVPSLSSPDPRYLPAEEKELIAIVSEYEAVHLFVERARLQKPDFTLTRENAVWLSRLCHRMEGLPLAIELAAARISVLSLQEITERLDDCIRLLRGGSRTAASRQQTLQATLDWSYALLTEQERRLLERLSVFAGGWTLAAAERVCSGEGIETWEVLDLLTSLVSRSLALFEEWEERSRYRLLEVVRQYARQKLAENAQVALRQRHREYFWLWPRRRSRNCWGRSKGNG
ncbi:MAG TPA: hypothetical protein VKT32_03140, partial [Chthonomonadaceae bacterium]|nr:hypothetical protein [Chthonomonadaceae bacterium]